MKVTISDDGSAVLPAEVLARYGLEPGDQVHLVEHRDYLVVRRVFDDPIRDAAGILAGPGRSLTEVLLEERARDVERE